MDSSRKRSPAFEAKLATMRAELAPIVNITSGQAHPDYPTTLLHFWLLTEFQLNSLATFYDQSTVSRYTYCYPAPMNWVENAPLSVKRRKFGKFVGLRGCQTPTNEKFGEAMMVEKEDNFGRWEKKWC